MIGIALSLFILWVNTFGVMLAIKRNTLYLAFTLALIFMIYPTSKKKPTVLDWIWTSLGLAVGLYTFFFYEPRVIVGSDPTMVDFAFAALAIITIVEATRRSIGPVLPIISSIFLLYAYFGPYLPDAISHQGMNVKRILELMYLEDTGIYGQVLGVAATFIYVFILLGAYLREAGTAEFFNKFALAVSGRSVGGPAKVAVISSGIMGTISGSAVANVATTGTFTIPLMKKIGYRPYYAGAVEAAASTGGLIMPPIMGTAAFVMSEFLGLSYVKIMISAIIPALLYYFAVFVSVHYAAIKSGMKTLSSEEIPSLKETLMEGGHLFVPVIMLVFAMFFSGRSVVFSGGIGILYATMIIFSGRRKFIPVGTAAAVGILHHWIDVLLPATLFGVILSFEICLFEAAVQRHEGKITICWRKVLNAVLSNMVFIIGAVCVYASGKYSSHWLWPALGCAVGGYVISRSHDRFDRTMRMLVRVMDKGARGSLSVGIACAIVGFVVGVATTTSLGQMFAANIMALSHNILFFALVFTMLAAIITSMGLPATACYIVIVVVAAPALINMGVSELQAHMFVFYFGILSNITPPVALASYTAAGVSGGSPSKVAWTGLRLTLTGFIIPYMFVYSPQLLLQDVQFPSIIVTILTAFIGVFLLATSGESYLIIRMAIYERVLFFIAAFLTIFPGLKTDLIGIGCVALAGATHLMRARMKRTAPAV
ncbi:MAG: TRAP transporter fused permease subunit [Deltaproteobacteria bacterium]|nr:TRAP transporter fused permease subunit [Deltaproteobacteria bacterium]MBW2151435.1 TRAP transporter fused permease subunit [Deltaproteobacteria bacterium]